MTTNSLQHRWKLDDPEWVKARKRQWKNTVAYLRTNLDISVKQHKYWREFFLTGKEVSVPLTYFSPFYRLCYTPSNSVEDVKEVMATIRPWELKGVYSFVPGFDVDYVGHDDGMLGGQEKYIVRALFPEKFEPTVVEDRGQACKLHEDPDEFVKLFEMLNYFFLTDPYCSCHLSTQYLIEHWLSCLTYVEAQGGQLEGDKFDYRRPLLSAARHFVEPRGRRGEDTPARRFAEKLCHRLKADDIPDTIRKAWQELEPDGVWEVKRGGGENYGFNAQSMSETSAVPEFRVLHDLSPKEAIAGFIDTAAKLDFLQALPQFDMAEPVNIGPCLGHAFKETLGYAASADTVPALRLDVYMNRRFICSHFDEAQVWIEFYVLYPQGDALDQGECPTLLYVPRMTEHYLQWCSTVGLLLNERQLLSAFNEKTGHYFFEYSDNGVGVPTKSDKLGRRLEFIRMPFYGTEVDPLNDHKGGILNVNVEGLDTAPWQGEPLSPISALLGSEKEV